MNCRIIKLTIGSLIFLSIGCVSVKLPSTEAAKAKGISIKEPAAPFKPISTAQADRAWQSSTTANNISYLSECQKTSDLSLRAIQTDSLAGIEGLKILNSKNEQFNGREALMIHASGYVDGVPIEIELAIFKKNNCSYVLSYSGLKRNFQKERDYFESFKQGFKAP